jgi:hypothetical protein
LVKSFVHFTASLAHVRPGCFNTLAYVTFPCVVIFTPVVACRFVPDTTSLSLVSSCSSLTPGGCDMRARHAAALFSCPKVDSHPTQHNTHTQTTCSLWRHNHACGERQTFVILSGQNELLSVLAASASLCCCALAHPSQLWSNAVPGTVQYRLFIYGGRPCQLAFFFTQTTVLYTA